MLYSSFGHSRINLPGPVDAALELVQDRLDSYSAKILLRDTYETLYQIFDHDKHAKSRPLALVAMHAKENVSEYSKLYRFFYRYHHANIKELFNLTPHEFLQYPHEFVELMFKIAYEHAKREAPKLDAATRAIEREFRS